MPGELLRTDVGDLTFDVRVDGPEDGRPVLLLHGFPETSASWTSVSPLLAQAGLRTYAPDQLGYSPGARPDEVAAYTAQNLAQVTADLMTALELPVADVVGHDWGANVAWTLAAWHPDRVRRMLSGGGEQATGVPEEAIEEYVAVLTAPGALTAALNWYRAMSSDTRVDPIEVPTTYVWSDGDAAIGRTAAEACANYVTGDYRFVELPGITHWIPEQAPEQLASAILERVAAG